MRLRFVILWKKEVLSLIIISRWANLLSTNETIAGIYETPKTIDELK